MSITAVIPHYWGSREAYLPRIVAALRRGTVAPTAILIWNNTDSVLTVPGASVINAGCNYGIAARFAAAYLARTEFVLFQDNDLEVQYGTVDAMLAAAKAEPEGTSVELQGRMLGTTPGRRYLESEYFTDVDRVVDVGLSRISVMTRKTAMRLCAVIPPDVTDDDLWTSRHVRVKLIPYGASQGWINYPESEGLSRNVAEHIGRRDALVERLWGG